VCLENRTAVCELTREPQNPQSLTSGAKSSCCAPSSKQAFEEEDIEEVERKNKNIKEEKEAVLEVTVFKAYSLANPKKAKSIDPFIRLQAVDGNKILHEWDDSVVRKGFSPRFDHDYPWKKGKNQLGNDWTLKFQVWDRSVGPDNFLGEAEFTLSSVNSTKWIMRILPLEARLGKKDPVSGFLSVSVRYNNPRPSSAGREDDSLLS